jgi:hypothetical protein
MASVHVALVGPSAAAVHARLEEIARVAEVSLSPMHATARSTFGAPSSTYDMTTSLHAPSLDDEQLRAKLAPFEDESVDPHVGVRFVLDSASS